MLFIFLAPKRLPFSPEEKGWRNDRLDVILGRRRLSLSLVFNLAAPPGEPSPLRRCRAPLYLSHSACCRGLFLSERGRRGSVNLSHHGDCFPRWILTRLACDFIYIFFLLLRVGEGAAVQ